VKTLGELKQSRIKEIAQSCSTSDDFKSLINEATERLMSRGDWVGSLVPIQVCLTRDSCVVWPRYTGQVRRINYCGQHIKTRNEWFDFVGPEQYCGWYHQWGWGNQMGWGQFYNRNLVSLGFSCTFQDIPLDKNCLIRVYPLCQADVGKTITIFGVDTNGQPLMTKDATTGEWSEGLTLTLSLPFVSTSIYVRQITRVIREQTNKNTPMYAYDAADDTLFQLANYEPSETNPQYVKDRLNLGCYRGNCDLRSIVALVKLRFIPVQVDTDLVLINSIAALKLAVQAIKFEEASEDERAFSKWTAAIHELNIQLENDFPMEVSTAIDTGFSPVESFGRQRVI
jgi:hypothetical protein